MSSYELRVLYGHPANFSQKYAIYPTKSVQNSRYAVEFTHFFANKQWFEALLSGYFNSRFVQTRLATRRKKTQHLLAPRGELAEPYDLTFGRDGKPFFVAGPRDNVGRILRQLEKTAGPGNYDYLALVDSLDL